MIFHFNFKFHYSLLAHRKVIYFWILILDLASAVIAYYFQDNILDQFFLFSTQIIIKLLTKTVLFLSSQSVHLLFPFFVLLHKLELSVQCWKGVLRGDILILYLILGGKFQVSHHYSEVSGRSFGRYSLWSWGSSWVFRIESLSWRGM